MQKNEFKIILKYTLPVMAGYVFLGFAFGLLMLNKGFSPFIPIIMSIVIYSGALEFAAVPVLSASFDPLGSFILGLMLSARHIFYGIPMLKKYARFKKSKFLLVFGLTDETFSILSSKEMPEGIRPKVFYLGVTLFNFSYWVFGTFLGACFGNFVNLKLEGLDFALTALFICLFIDQINTREGKLSGFSGLIVSAIVLSLAGSEYFVLLSMALVLILLLLGRRVIENE